MSHAICLGMQCREDQSTYGFMSCVQWWVSLKNKNALNLIQGHISIDGDKRADTFVKAGEIS
jgi:hypothetical protein